ncbi:MAG: tRNA uridine-5-carboxymethylaminomethyl(34) synthesis GTPase MnmE [Calditrichaeota bacterium]|nr:MAG: tRNA uridine-5-carboxymethylaminomethyl(34) synthesis GTPase MnmE [Calditrichota bacterium]
MKFLPEEDTIVALSSPLGKGAIALIRVSGSQSLTIVNKNLKTPISPKDVRKAHFTDFVDTSDGHTIDQVVVTFFKAPHSYTGEDVLEISCHCNHLIINDIIHCLIKNGARTAEPGEFTFRAFMNGKLDLSQAEAVAEVINSRTRQSLNQSLRHLEGKLSEKISLIKNEILNYLSLMEINLDFSDEEIEVMPLEHLVEKIDKTINELNHLKSSYDYGRLLQEGIKMLILGKPNVGKSSLLNALLKKERAIVSDIPGTTRDYIEASLEIDGLSVQAVDTAGIRHTEDTIEAMGVQRALEQIKTTDIVLCLFEAPYPLNQDDEKLIEIINEYRETVKFLLVLNKIDISINRETEKRLKSLNLPEAAISAEKHTGLEKLKGLIKEQLVSDFSMESEEVVVTSARHFEALNKTIESLQHARDSVLARATEEIIAVDLRLALDHLGEITGETTPEDVLNHIFANFCIGK